MNRCCLLSIILAKMMLALMLSGFAGSRVLAVEPGGKLDFLRLPPGASVSWVGQRVQHNGIMLDIQRFRSDQPVATVLQFYRDVWAVNATDSAPGSQEQSIGDWRVISTLENDYSIVLQIRTGLHGVSEGFFSALSLSLFNPVPRANLLPRDIPLPAGSGLLSRTVSGDSLKRGITLIIENTATVSQNTRFFRNRMAQFGWRLSTAAIHAEQAALMFDKSGGYCELSINATASGKTLLLINRVGHET